MPESDQLPEADWSFPPTLRPEAPLPPTRRDRRPDGQPAAGPKRRGLGRLLAVLALVLVVLAVAVSFVAVRLGAAPPPAVVTPTVGAVVKADPGQVAPTLPWPKTGQSAVAVPTVGINVASGPEHAAPIASLTKLMTAYVILHDHPLGPAQSGPIITVNQADVDDFENDTVQDEANAQVALGEQLTERQVLGGMLVHSANNFADLLATWDAGSIAAFVVRMNHTAHLLGMDHTHYADTSGFNPASQSTPSDLLRVAQPDMENPTFAAIVRMPSITLPVAGTISSYTPLLGLDGVIGVKSGFTSVAGGCDVVAVVRQVHGEPVMILGAVTGQEGPNVLDLAAFDALILANAMSHDIGSSQLVAPGAIVAHVTAAGHTVGATVQGSVTALTWPGVRVSRLLVTTRPITSNTRAGTRIGSLEVVLGQQQFVLPVGLARRLPKESLTQRVF